MRETLIVSAGPAILPEFLPIELRRLDSIEPSLVASADEMCPIPGHVTDLSHLIRDVEAALNREQQHGIYPPPRGRGTRPLDLIFSRTSCGRRPAIRRLAAEILGISRPTLRMKLLLEPESVGAKDVVEAFERRIAPH